MKIRLRGLTLAISACILSFAVPVGTVWIWGMAAPACAKRSWGLGFVIGPLMVGTVVAATALAGNLYLAYRRPRPVDSVVLRLSQMIGVAISAMLISLAVVFTMTGSFRHTGAHECHRIPWSP